MPEPLDCEDFMYEALYNDLADRTLFHLGKGSPLCHGVGVRYNGQAAEWFRENATQPGVFNVLSFELAHGQDRFRLLASGQVSVQDSFGQQAAYPYPTTHSSSIAFKVFNISRGTSAIICQIFKSKTEFDSARAAAIGPVSNVTPGVVAPYIVDLNDATNGSTTFSLSFEQPWPDDIYPLPGTTDVCQLRVIFSALNPIAAFGPQICNFVDLKAILEPIGT